MRYKVYAPQAFLKQGLFALIAEIWNELARNRWLTWQLFKRDFVAGYKQYLLGFWWVVFVPFASILSFMLLNKAGIVSFGSVAIPYPLYAFAGISFWQIFATGLINATHALVNAAGMIGKINFCRKSLVIATLGQATVFFLIQIAVGTGLFFYYRYIPSEKALLIPFLFLPLALLTLGLGFICAILNTMVREIANLLSFLMTFLMLITPVLYQRPSSGVLAAITRYNPLYYLVAFPRDMILYGQSAEGAGFWASSAFSIALLGVSLVFFHIAESKIAERL
ncbi:MAG TPA: ABC transporter permease [Candidatus Omnitrophota bacterium]|nr:ABC transporter permease [Candidatus Omnitrophota bacterium]HRZ14512.1 ABC transporter permease [Candidatus Omnitrophota bacterium]